MQYIFRFLTLLLPLAVLLCCTIEKRLHRSGYHIEWKKRFGKTNAQEPQKHFFISKEPVAEESLPESVPVQRSDTNQYSGGDSLSPTRGNVVSLVKLPAPKDIVQQKTLKQPLTESRNSSATEKQQRLKLNELDKLAAFIITVIVLYVAIMLTCLIVGFLIVDTSPVWGIILLVIGGWMLLGPIMAMVSSSIASRRKGRLQPPPAEAPKTVKTFASLDAVTRYFSRLRRHAYPSQRDMTSLGLFFLLFFLVYIAIMVLGIIFGISLIAMGSYFWGILLLTIGSLLALLILLVIGYGIVSDRKDAKKRKESSVPVDRKTFSATSANHGIRRFPSGRQMRNAFIAIGILFLLYLTGMVLAIVYGFLLLGTAPFWAPFLLILGFSMLGVPLLIFFTIVIMDNIRWNRKAKEQKKTAAFAGNRFRKESNSRPFFGLPKGFDKLDLLIIALVLVAIAVLIVCLVYGISFFAMGTWFWGILLLALGAAIFFVPVIGTIREALRQRRMQRELERRMERHNSTQMTGRFSRLAGDELPEEDRRSPKEKLLIFLGVLAALIGIGLLTIGGIALLASFPIWGIGLIAVAGIGFCALIAWLLMQINDRLEDDLFGFFLLTMVILCFAAGVFAVGFGVALIVAEIFLWGILLAAGGALLLGALITLLVVLSGWK